LVAITPGSEKKKSEMLEGDVMPKKDERNQKDDESFRNEDKGKRWEQTVEKQKCPPTDPVSIIVKKRKKKRLGEKGKDEYTRIKQKAKNISGPESLREGEEELKGGERSIRR